MGQNQNESALVLSRRNVGEADRLITLLTVDSGLLRVLAKGVRRIPSRRGGHVEPLTRIEATIHASGSYLFLTDVSTVHYHQDLRSKPALLSQAGRMASAIEHLFVEGEGDRELVDSVARSWALLPLLSESQRLMLEAALLLSFLRRAGLAPLLDYCMGCQRYEVTGSVVLERTAGGWYCSSCRRFPQALVSFPAEALLFLKRLMHVPQAMIATQTVPAGGAQLFQAVQQYVFSPLTNTVWLM
jgi:DNA repair protein RecO (recombination protein O)